MTHQRGPGFKEEQFPIEPKSLMRSKNLVVTSKAATEDSGSSRKDWIELRMDILGTVTLPETGDTNFEFVVKKAFNQDEEGYIYNIKRDRIELDSNEDKDYFQGINQILARLPTKVTGGSKGGNERILGLSEWHFISACVGLLIAGVLSYLYVLRYTGRLKGKQNKGKSSRSFASSINSVSSSGTYPSGGMTFPTVRQSQILPAQHRQSQIIPAQLRQSQILPSQPQQYVPPPSIENLRRSSVVPDHHNPRESTRNLNASHRLSSTRSLRSSGSSSLRSSVSASVRSSDDGSVRSSRSRKSMRSSDDGSVRSSGSRNSTRSSGSSSVRSSSGRHSSRKSVSNPPSRRRSSRRVQGDGIHRTDASVGSRSSKRGSVSTERSNGVMS